MYFLNISTSVQSRLATETRLSDGEFLQVTVNRVEFLKLQTITLIKFISTRDGPHFETEQMGIQQCIMMKSSVVHGMKL